MKRSGPEVCKSGDPLHKIPSLACKRLDTKYDVMYSLVIKYWYELSYDFFSGFSFTILLCAVSFHWNETTIDIWDWSFLSKWPNFFHPTVCVCVFVNEVWICIYQLTNFISSSRIDDRHLQSPQAVQSELESMSDTLYFTTLYSVFTWYFNRNWGMTGVWCSKKVVCVCAWVHFQRMLSSAYCLETSFCMNWK